MLEVGNLVFRSNTRRNTDLERLLEVQAENRLDLQTDFLVRTANKWNVVVARNPFQNEAERDPAHLVVMFLKSPPNTQDVDALHKANRDRSRRRETC